MVTDSFAQTPFDGRDKHIGIDRLAEDASEVGRVHVTGISGHQHDRNVTCVGTSRDLALHVEAAETRQAQVEDDDGGRGLFDVAERTHPVFDGNRRIPGRYQGGSIEGSKTRIVFDDQDRRAPVSGQHAD